MGGFLLVTADTSSNSQNLHWCGSLLKRNEPPALFIFLSLLHYFLEGAIRLYLIFSVCCLHLWFQLVQQTPCVFKELMGKVVRAGVWIRKIEIAAPQCSFSHLLHDSSLRTAVILTPEEKTLLL